MTLRLFIFFAFLCFLFLISHSYAHNLHTLLFYTCVTKEIKNQCNESFTLDQVGIANRGTTSNFTTIEQGYSKGITTLFAVHDTFFENGVGMRADWKARWEALKTKLDPLYDSEVTGFFLGDELLSGGKISLENFTTALDALNVVKETHPSLFIWANEGGTEWTGKFKKTGIPRGLDIISIDDYYLSVSEHHDFYANVLYPLLGEHQATFLVPGAYATRNNPKKSQWCNGDGTLKGCDKFMVERTQEFLDWALDDDRIVGFAPWHWDSRGVEEVSQYKEVGVVEMPLLTELYRKIGQLVKQNAD